MIQNFDIYNRYEVPNYTLCNPDSTEICSLIAYDRKVSLRFNNASEISFKVYSVTSDINRDIVPLESYEKIQTKRLVLIDGIGYFQIQSAVEVSDGVSTYKEVRAISCQNEMGFKSMAWFDGTYKFYDVLDNSNTIIGKIMEMIPDWSIDTVSSDLFNKYRTFESINTTLLNFITADVSEAYECIFLFDFLNRKITVKSIEDLTQNPYTTEIYLSFKNLLKNFQIEENSDDIVTALSVYGQDLDVRQVNPLGSTYIYNFSHFMNTRWMPQSLIDAITNWNTAISTQRPIYANHLSNLQAKNGELLVLTTELTDLEASLTSLENIRSARIEQGIDYTDINTQIAAAENNINTKKTAIEAKKGEISNITNNMAGINTSLSFENNFTPEQLSILKKFIYEHDYTNTYYVVTDLMSSVDIQNSAMELYNEGVNALARMSQPRYTFRIDSTNFMFIKDFERFTSQLRLGCMVTVELEEDKYAYPILLEMQFDYDNPEDFSLTFGNRFRLDDSVYTFNEMLGEAHNTANKTNAKWDKLNEFSNTYKDSVSEFLNNAFDVSKKAIINSSNQSQVWDSSGMTFRKVENGVIDDKQIKIINNQIVFTDDSWNSVKTVLGQINLDGGGTAYGVAAEIIIGRIIAGNNLTITNENNTFTVDSTGAKLINADFSLINSSVKNRVLLNATDGIKIQKNTGTTISPVWENHFYADNDGNIVMSGKITATDGLIGGWNINANTIYSNNVGLYSGTNYSYTTGGLSKNIRIYAGAALSNSTDSSGIPFVVDESGRLKATNAVITGIINASSGQIGGRLGFGAGSTYQYISGSDLDEYRIYINGTPYAGGGSIWSFSVDRLGQVKCSNLNCETLVSSGGTIGGLSFDNSWAGSYHGFPCITSLKKIYFGITGRNVEVDFSNASVTGLSVPAMFG